MSSLYIAFRSFLWKTFLDFIFSKLPSLVKLVKYVMLSWAGLKNILEFHFLISEIVFPRRVFISGDEWS